MLVNGVQCVHTALVGQAESVAAYPFLCGIAELHLVAVHRIYHFRLSALRAHFPALFRLSPSALLQLHTECLRR